MTPADQFAEACRGSLPAHRYCEDTWYSCPLEPSEGCADDQQGKECNCGYERALTRLRTMARAFADVECTIEELRGAPRSQIRRATRIADFLRECGLEGDHAP